jgi:hypothetical protein
VTVVTDEVRALCEDMAETMYAAPGVGLAAPQIGVSLKLFVIDVAFFASNMLKLFAGGWFPLVIGIGMFTLKQLGNGRAERCAHQRGNLPHGGTRNQLVRDHKGGIAAVETSGIFQLLKRIKEVIRWQTEHLDNAIERCIRAKQGDGLEHTQRRGWQLS